MSFEVIVSRQQENPVILLKDNKTQTAAEIYAFGGLLNTFHIQTADCKQNIVAGFESVADARLNITNGFKSAKLSPFVCRMDKGKYKWKDESFQIQKWFLGNHAIHGIIYDADYRIISTNADNDSASVKLQYDYAAQDAGYPFPYSIEIYWELRNGNQLTVQTTIYNNGNNAIPITDGWHPYFCLGETVNDCTLQFDSNQMLEFDSELIPTGKMISDDRFLKGLKINSIFLDNCFLLDQTKTKPGCRLTFNNIQLIIEPDHHYPYLQLYTPDDRKKIAIENLSAAPDAFNNKMGLLELEPQQHISFSTTYTVATLVL